METVLSTLLLLSRLRSRRRLARQAHDRRAVTRKRRNHLAERHFAPGKFADDRR